MSLLYGLPSATSGGTDNIPTSIGDKWQQGPIANPGEMAFSHTLVIDMLKSIPGYVAEFRKAFGNDTVDIEKVTKAIAAFEETLVTPNSRFDKWLKGNKKALTKDELAGCQLFKDTGCVACHNGPAGNSRRKKTPRSSLS